MKKIYSLLSILLFGAAMVLAQSPQNRTAKTIVADVLAQMPAQKTEQYYKQIKDLSSTGEDGVLQLIKMINPPGKGSNASVEYALSGLSHYVTGNGLEAERLTTVKAYIKALDIVNDNDTKAFIIRQLEITGKDEAVAKLSTYLNDTSLSGPAARALASIDTPAAGKALQNALGTASDKSQEDIVLAIAKMQLAESEMRLKTLLNSNNPNLQKVVLYALSHCGSKVSLPELATAAEKAGYAMEPTGANEAYIALIKRVLAQGDVKEAEKAASDLMKKAEKAGQHQSREAALEIMIAAKPADILKLLQKALKDNDRKYRYAALNFTSDYASAKIYTELIKSLKKYDPEVQLDIINWLGQEASTPEKRNIIADTGNETMIAMLTDRNIEIREALARTLARTEGHNVIVALAGLLNDADEKTVTIAKNALNTISGDISTAVAPVIATANSAGKVAGLELLANRKSSKNVNIVIDQTKSNVPSVKTAAYKALKDVVSADNLTTLYNLLENAPSDAIIPIQQAIATAIKSYPSDKKLDIISSRINQVSTDKQYLYYPVLAATENVKALDIITERFAKESGSAKDAAFQTLLDWKGSEAAGELYNICKDPSSVLYLDRAINKYIQLASDPKLSGENRRLLLTQAIEIARTDAQKNTILSKIGNTDSYLGMLLAGQYLDNKSVQQSAAGAVMNIALNNKNYTGKNVETLLNKAIEILNNPDAEYQRQAIRKHLNEMPKEEGFVSIFNGKDLFGWKGLVGNPITRNTMKPAELAKRQVTADDVAKRHWKAENGILIFDGVKGGDNLCTEKQYGDIEMYIDWNLDPAGPEADAGIYLRGTPQVQIWDTARVKVGAQVGSGGLYNNRKNQSKPLKVADNKLGEWNTFYIKMVDDRVTVKLNGELVVDNIILENFWDREQILPITEQLELQAHGSKVYYRNIYVKELERSKPFELSAEEKKEGYKILFDGTNMDQWTGNKTDYRSEGGCISLYPSVSHGGNLYTKEEFGDFIFRFQFQLTPAANNGLGIRTPMEGDAAYVGMELQILDNDAPVYSTLAPYQYHGSVYGIIAAKRGYLKPTGEWNYQEVIAKGDNIKITLNGTVILDGNIREATKDGTPDKQKHPGLFNKKGHIGFLGHGSPVKFKDIRIKELQ